LTTGTYTIKLLSMNDYGCLDSNSKSIKIMNPVLDLAVSNVTKSIGNKYLNIQSQIINLGTRDVFNFDIITSIADGSTIKESWNGFLASGTSLNYIFNASFETQSEIGPEFICVKIKNPNGENDDVPQNDEQCITTENFLLLDPNPNPATGKILVRFIIPVSGHVNIQIIDNLGQIVYVPYSDIAPQGLNDLSINIDKFANGIYTIQAVYKGSYLFKKFTKF